MTPIVDYNTAKLIADTVYGRTTQGAHGDIPSGWILDISFNRDGEQNSNPGELALSNGFYAYALRPVDPTDSRRILAFRGTEDVKDLLADVADIGQTQFGLASGFINQWLAQQLVENRSVELVGHSLGGALVQWAINDTNLANVTQIAQTLPDPNTGVPNSNFQIDPARLHFTTFNAPGITLAPGGLIAGNTTTVVDGEHHIIALDFALPLPGLRGDFVHLLGGRPVGGSIVAHRVDYENFDSDGNILDAHLIGKPWWNEPVDSGHVPPFALDLQRAQAVGQFVANLVDANGHLRETSDAVKVALVLGLGLSVGTTFQLGTQLRTLVEGIGGDLQTLAARLSVPGTAGLQEGLSYLLDEAKSAGRNAALFTFDLATAALTTVKVFAGSSLAVSTLAVNELGKFIKDTATGIGNAFSELLQGVPGVFDLGRTLGFGEYKTFEQAYGQALQDRTIDSALRSALEDAQDIVQRAGQTVVIQTGMGPNPFDTPGFVPGAASSAMVEERLGEEFRLSLPFAAGVGGQRVSLQLQGPQVTQLSVSTSNGVVALGANGTFELTVPEGADQLSFSLMASNDVSSDASVTLSATLVDATGTPTHTMQVESMVTVKAFVGNTDTRYEIYEENWEGATSNLAMGMGGLIVSPLPDGSFFVQAFHQRLTGGEGSDMNIFDQNAHGDDILIGNGGNDLLAGGPGHDVLSGGEDNDTLYGDVFLDDEPEVPWPHPIPDPRGVRDGKDYVDGGNGNDLLAGGGNADRLIGGAGDDVLWGDAYTVGRYEALPDGGERAIHLTGVLHPGNDVLEGGNGNDFLSGDGGDDTLDGGDGDDLLIGDTQQGLELLFPMAPGDDYLVGGIGNDELQGNAGHDVLLGGAGDDRLYGDDTGVDPSQEGDDWLEGGAGADFLAGRGGNDTLNGGNDADVLFADAGDDTLIGGEGDDVGFGGDGADDIIAGAGADQFDGESGNDVLVGDDGIDLLIGGDGLDTLDGGADDDLLIGGSDQDTLFGGEGADELQGGLGNDVLAGDAGDDRMFGQEENDELFGGDGNDGLRGDDGDDQLDGGAGDDSLQGDAGDDVLVGVTLSVA